MTKFPGRIMVLAMLAGSSALSHSQVTPAQTRGGLLYTTHCVACHTTQMHWRNDRLAIDWDSLKFQVRRWQSNASLAWNEADITEVSRYLNETIYRYPAPTTSFRFPSGQQACAATQCWVKAQAHLRCARCAHQPSTSTYVTTVLAPLAAPSTPRAQSLQTC